MSRLRDIWAGSLKTELELADLKVHAAKKELLTATAEREARVAQELAIAERIGTALEVTIEEYYEYKNDGAASITVEKIKADVAISGSGQRVTKRIYTFKGIAQGSIELGIQPSDA